MRYRKNKMAGGDQKTKGEKVSIIGLFFKLIYLTVYVLILWVFLSKFAFLPKAIAFPLKEYPKGLHSVFYYTGNSFTSNLEELDKETVEPGAIVALDLFSNNNIAECGYYDPVKQEYYIREKSKISRFSIGKGELKTVVQGKTDAVDDPYRVAIPYENVYICPTAAYGVTVTANGTHNDLNCDFTEEEISYEKIADILCRNINGKITLREFLEVIYRVRIEELLYWNPDTELAVFSFSDRLGPLGIMVYEKGSFRDSYYLAAPEESGYTFSGSTRLFGLSDQAVCAIDYGNGKFFKYDFISNVIYTVMDMPASNYPVVYRVLPDGSLVVAGTDEGADSVWFFIEQQNKIYTMEPYMEDVKRNYLMIGDSTIFEMEKHGKFMETAYRHVDFGSRMG